MRHLDFIVLHDLHQICHYFRHINLPHLHAAVLHQKSVYILIKLSLIRPGPELSQRHYSLLYKSHITESHPLHSLSDHLPVVLCQTPHHSHINPDNLSIPDLHIAGMGIRMEEPIVHHLFNIVIHQLAADLFQIVALGQQRLLVVNSAPVNKLHHKHMDGGVLLVQNRSSYKRYILVPAGEFFHIGSLCQKVHLIPCDRPHLIQDKIQIGHALDTDRRKKFHRFMKEGNISGHFFINALSLDFYYDLLPGFQNRCMHLGNGSRALRLLLNGREHSLPGAAVGLFNYIQYFLKRHWRHFRPEPHQLIAVALRKNIRMHGHNLSQLNKCGAQILQNQPQLLRRNAFRDIMSSEYGSNFPQS